MFISIILFFFVLGLIIGSFLNVVILRHHTGVSIDGRSGCMVCSKQLVWFELIPVVSYICLRGRCSGCKSKISLQYPLVELATGILFVSLFWIFKDLFLNDPTQFAFIFVLHAIALSLLVVIFVYDIYHKIIPDFFSYLFAAVSIGIMLLSGDAGFENTTQILNLFSGLILFIPFYALWLFSRGKWIGLGDGKLALGIGWLLGFTYGVSAIIVSFWIGALVSIAIMLIYNLKHHGKGITMKTEIPFAPFLILGTLFELYLHVDVIGISLLM